MSNLIKEYFDILMCNLAARKMIAEINRDFKKLEEELLIRRAERIANGE
jgi:hypothetical protein